MHQHPDMQQFDRADRRPQCVGHLVVTCGRDVTPVGEGRTQPLAAGSQVGSDIDEQPQGGGDRLELAPLGCEEAIQLVVDLLTESSRGGLGRVNAHARQASCPAVVGY